jgi:hypothetical protein
VTVDGVWAPERVSRGILDQLRAGKPAGFQQFLAVNGDVLGDGGGAEADHQAGWERPGLGRYIAHLADPDPGLLADLAADGVLEALADLNEARECGVPAGDRPAMAGEQDAPGVR